MTNKSKVRICVMVSGGGTNLQAIIDQVEDGRLTGVSLEVVISNNAGAYALERARQHNIPAVCYDSTEILHGCLLTVLPELL